MTNFEKYKDEIRKIVEEDENCLAFYDGKPCKCGEEKTCEGCAFDNHNSCFYAQMEWAAAEAEPTMTAEEAWELARKIAAHSSFGGFTIDEVREIFGKNGTADIMNTLSLQEAKAKIEAWERKKQIEVGNILKGKDSGMMCIVTMVSDDKVELLWQDGLTGKKMVNEMAEQFEPTGRKLNILKKLLEAIGE